MRGLVRAILSAALAGCPTQAEPTPVPQRPAATPSATKAPAEARESPRIPKLVDGEGGGLYYVEAVTGSAGAHDKLPMIVAIHGLGDNPHSFGRRFLDFPGPARWIFPRALDDYDGGGYSWFPYRARDNKVAELARGIGVAADRIAHSVGALTRERPTVGKPIVTGFSQGGMLTFALAVRHPDVFSAAFPISGWLPPPLWPQQRPEGAPPIVAYHGTVDVAVKYEPTKEAVEHLQSLGLRVRLNTYEDVGHAVTPQMHADVYSDLFEAARALGQ